MKPLELTLLWYFSKPDTSSGTDPYPTRLTFCRHEHGSQDRGAEALQQSVKVIFCCGLMSERQAWKHCMSEWGEEEGAISTGKAAFCGKWFQWCDCAVQWQFCAGF